MFRRSPFLQVTAALLLTGLLVVGGIGLYRLGFIQGALVSGEELVPRLPYGYGPFLPFGFFLWLPLIFLFGAIFLRLAFGGHRHGFRPPFWGGRFSYPNMEAMLERHPHWREWVEAYHARLHPEAEKPAPGDRQQPETE